MTKKSDAKSAATIRFMNVSFTPPTRNYVGFRMKTIYGRVDLVELAVEADMHDAIMNEGHGNTERGARHWHCRINGVTIATASTAKGAAARGEKWLRALLTPMVVAADRAIEERINVAEIGPEVEAQFRVSGLRSARSVMNGVFLPSLVPGK